MKKSLLAMAAMTAFAGAAQAQSSVTVYGIVDVGFSGTSTRGAAAAYSNGTPATDAVNNTQIQTNQIGSGYEATSRLGFKGTEDLGGGMSGFFTVEIGLNPTDPTVLSAAPSENRQSFVGVAKKGLGNVAIGTQYTPIFNSMTATNPGANNSVVGSMIYPVSSSSASNTNSEALTVRKNNAITFTTEKFAGFSAQGIYSVNNKDQNQTAAAFQSTALGGTTDAYSYGLALNYNWQKLLVTGAWQQNRNKTAATVVSTVNAASLAANSGDNQYYVAATYDFGILKGYAGYINRQVTSSINTNVFVKRAGTQLGVRSYITPTIEAWGQVGMGRYTAAGVGEPTANFTTYQVGANYYLSKRTNLYAIYGQNSTNTTSNVAGINSSAAASQYAMGVRHTF